MQTRHRNGHTVSSAGWLALAVSACAVLALSPGVEAAPAVTSLTLNPDTIAGGSSGTSTGTVTISEPASPGGAVVVLGSSNTALAASALSVTIPEGATTASFTVATNPDYRRYSGLAFTVTISGSAGGATATDTLEVTAQPIPGPIQSDSTQRFGTTCGGDFPASRGEHGILYDCVVGPDPGTVGSCTFREECLLGCVTQPSANFEFFDACATSGPYPISVAPQWLEGGNPATATAHLEDPAPPNTNVLVLSQSSAATVFPTGLRSVPAGATSMDFTVATSILPSVEFVPLTVSFEIPMPQPGGSIFLANRLGLTWLAVAPPPENPPAERQPVLGFFEVSPDRVCGGSNSSATVWLSGVVESAATAVTVSLASSDPTVAQIPPSTTISTGSNVAVETITTSTVAMDTTVTITATEGPRSLSDSLTVAVPSTCADVGAECGFISNGCGGFVNCGSCTAPETCGGGGTPNVCGISTLTLTATGRAGETVFSTPPGLSVPVGQAGSASFEAGTEITLEVTRRRKAIWSGACDSGGRRTRTCTFVITGDASVTAEVF